MATGVAYISNDNLVWVRGAKRARDGTEISAGTATLTAIRDRHGNTVDGQTFPTIMFYTGADGDWVAQMDDALELAENEIYSAVIDLDAGGGIKGHWEIPFLARKRRS
jgi:hypothetical protein